MFSSENLTKINKDLKGEDIGKGKKYVLVNSRVAAFRQICPDGSITTEILSLEDGVVTIQATIKDEAGKIISTGLAQEEKGAGFVNKTSFIENCETSAVGRALAFAGIGSDESIASAEEVANAILQQNKYPDRDEMIKAVAKKYPEGSENLKALLKTFNVGKLEEASDAQIKAAYNKVKK